MRGRPATWLLLACLGVTFGCAELRYVNTAPHITQHVRANDESNELIAFKTWVLYPGRDLLTFDWLGRLLGGDEAWNADTDFDAGTSFYTARTDDELAPERLRGGYRRDADAPQYRRDADAPQTYSDVAPPRPPLRLVRKPRRGKPCTKFIAEDATGRRFLFKLDDPRYPELGSSASIIAARLLWALGYNVPAVFVTQIDGTGDERLDGRRATASLWLDGTIGHFRWDWFRYRREARALRIACAWINHVDCGGRNALVAVADGQARYILIDFDSCLGAWQGRPKGPWRGWQHEGDPGWNLLRVLSLGLLHPEPDPRQPIVSPAIGRFDADFDPRAWRPQAPNTAFDHMTPADLRWIAERIRRLDRPRIEAIVAAAELTDPADADYLVETLLARRQRILDLAAAAPKRGAARREARPPGGRTDAWNARCPSAPAAGL